MYGAKLVFYSEEQGCRLVSGEIGAQLATLISSLPGGIDRLGRHRAAGHLGVFDGFLLSSASEFDVKFALGIRHALAVGQAVAQALNRNRLRRHGAALQDYISGNIDRAAQGGSHVDRRRWRSAGWHSTATAWGTLPGHDKPGEEKSREQYCARKTPRKHRGP